jgi:thiosulfate dehydrogenase
MTMEEREVRRSSGWAIALTVTAVIGVVVAAGAWFLIVQQRRQISEAVPAPTEEYGRRLFAETAWNLGPDNPDPSRRYSGSRLNCSSCHLDAGRQPGMLSLTETFQKYPRPSGRDGRVADLKERIDGCMERSMNGRKLPRDGVEMDAMVAYIKSVSDQWLALSPRRRVIVEPSSLRTPARAASVEAGEKVFEARCHVCHGRDGGGLPASRDMRRGYIFPPLWGDDSFNNGAGMARVLTAARFIKARMPFGQPDLTDDEAYDVAAYINSKPRPQMSPEKLAQDYPDRTTKPVDSPYGPWADPFPAEQHRFGPFQPIEAYYKKK